MYISDKSIEIEDLPNGLIYEETYGDTVEISAPIDFLPENWEEREPVPTSESELEKKLNCPEKIYDALKYNLGKVELKLEGLINEVYQKNQVKFKTFRRTRIKNVMFNKKYGGKLKWALKLKMVC